MKTRFIITTGIALLTLTFAPLGYSEKAPKKVEATVSDTHQNAQKAKTMAMAKATKLYGPKFEILSEKYTDKSPKNPIFCYMELEATYQQPVETKIPNTGKGHFEEDKANAKKQAQAIADGCCPGWRLVSEKAWPNEAAGHWFFTMIIEYKRKFGINGYGTSKAGAENEALNILEKKASALAGYKSSKVINKTFGDGSLVQCDLKITF